VSSSRVYAGQSAEHRVEARRRALLDAGLELLGTRGWSATTVRGICTEAGLTARFFYESFAGLDALAVAVFDEIAADATHAVTTAVAAAGGDRRERARAAIDAGVRALTDDPRRARVVFVEALGSEPLMRRRMRTMTALSEVIAGYGREDYAPPVAAEPLLRVTAGLLAGGIAELLIAWIDGALDVTCEELVADCADLFVGVGDAARGIAERRGQV
jgi:AcrR family transcriptional regulator